MEELAEASGSPRSILAHPRGRFGDCRFFHARKALKTKKGGVFEKARGV